MSSSTTLYCFTIFLLTASASAATTPGGYFLPVLKDKARLQYYTTFNLGTPPARISYSIDLNNPTNWIVGNLTSYNQSSSYHSLSKNSTKCTAYSGPDAAYEDCPFTPSPICNHHQCMGWASSPINPTTSFWGWGLDPVVEDLLSPLYSRGTLSKASIPRYPFVDTATTAPMKGLSQHVKGIVSLARNPMAIHAQISSAFKLPCKFALCLPSSTSVNGAVYFGGGPYVLPPSTVDLSASMSYISLVSNTRTLMNAYEPGDPRIAYFIKITSIQIDGTPVQFNNSLLSIDATGNGGTKLSTMEPYTKLDSEIYTAFVAAFVRKAKMMNITVAGPVSSFKTCFNTSSIKYNRRTGRGLPVIDLVMAGRSKWRIYGANSMVKVSSEVQCLAFFDAGPKSTVFHASTPSIVIGGKQMEDNLVEFDLEASKIGVTSSLLRQGTSCSQFKAGQV